MPRSSSDWACPKCSPQVLFEISIDAGWQDGLPDGHPLSRGDEHWMVSCPVCQSTMVNREPLTSSLIDAARKEWEERTEDTIRIEIASLLEITQLLREAKAKAERLFRGQEQTVNRLTETMRAVEDIFHCYVPWGVKEITCPRCQTTLACEALGRHGVAWDRWRMPSHRTVIDGQNFDCLEQWVDSTGVDPLRHSERRPHDPR